MSDKLLDIVIITYNSQSDISNLLDSLRLQTWRDFSITVIDNFSQDKTRGIIKKNYPEVTLIKNNENNYFSPACNQGLKNTSAQYVLYCNPDMVIDKNALQEFYNYFKTHPKFGSLGGKIYQLSMCKNKTEMLDSASIKILSSLQAIDRGYNEKDSGQFENVEQVFGHSGAFVLYNRKALNDIAINGEVFDNDFKMYKEDVDVAYRLNLRGWKNFYLPRVFAWHCRSINAKQNRKSRSVLIRRLSYTNHILTIFKNIPCGIFMKHFLPFFWYEIKKKVYILILDWPVVPALFAIVPGFFRMIKKRRQMPRRVINNSDLEKIIFG
ncbi:MAG: glycosyltransferase family 2 protein [bacterium]